MLGQLHEIRPSPLMILEGHGQPQLEELHRPLLSEKGRRSAVGRQYGNTPRWKDYHPGIQNPHPPPTEGGVLQQHRHALGGGRAESMTAGY